MSQRPQAPKVDWQAIVARRSTVAGPAARRNNVLASKCEYPPLSVTLLNLPDCEGRKTYQAVDCQKEVHLELPRMGHLTVLEQLQLEVLFAILLILTLLGVRQGKTRIKLFVAQNGPFGIPLLAQKHPPENVYVGPFFRSFPRA